QIIRSMLQGYRTQLQERGSAGEQIPRFIIAEGETIERASRRAAREAGLLFYENPEGNWVMGDLKSITSGGGSELRLGRDFTQWQVKADIVPGFKKYGMRGNMIPSEEDGYGKKAESIWDQGQRQMGGMDGMRMLRVLVDGHQTKQTIQQRNDYEQYSR